MCVGVVVSSSSAAGQPPAAVFSVFWIVDFMTDYWYRFFFLTCKTVPFVAKRLAATSWLTCPLLTGPASHLTPNIIKETPSFILDFITIQHNKKQTNKQTLFPVPSRLHLGLLCTKTSPHLSVTATYCESLIHFFDLTDCVQSFSQRSERLLLIAASHQI